MSKKNPCDGCYGCYFYGGRWATTKCCNYFLITGQRRPCPPGKECTVRIGKESTRRKAMTVNKQKQIKNMEKI